MRYTYYKGLYVTGLRYRTLGLSSHNDECIASNRRNGWTNVGNGRNFNNVGYSKTTRDEVRKLYPKAFKH